MMINRMHIELIMQHAQEYYPKNPWLHPPNWFIFKQVPTSAEAAWYVNPAREEKPRKIPRIIKI